MAICLLLNYSANKYFRVIIIIIAMAWPFTDRNRHSCAFNGRSKSWSCRACVVDIDQKRLILQIDGHKNAAPLQKKKNLRRDDRFLLSARLSIEIGVCSSSALRVFGNE